MWRLAHWARVGLGWIVGIVFTVAGMAVVIFGLLPFTDLGPVTGVWIGLVFAGYIFLGAAVVGGWMWYLRDPGAAARERGS